MKEEFKQEKERGRTLAFRLQELSDGLDVSFIADKLRQSCTILSHQTMLKTEYDLGLLEQVVDYVEGRNHLLDIPAISIYYYAFKCLRNAEDELSFIHLIEEIGTSVDLFNPSEKRDIFILAINYCIRKMNSGIASYSRIAFDLYKRGLEENIFIENGVLSRWTYNNAVVAGLKLKEYEWVEKAIHLYKEQLDRNTREDDFHFNLAKLYFNKKEFGKSMPLLALIKNDDLLHIVRSKVMLSQMYYELKEFDALENTLENLRVFVSRKKKIGYHKENYKNIIRLLKKLMNINPYDLQEKESLKNEIRGTSILTERQWFLQMVDAL